MAAERVAVSIGNVTLGPNSRAVVGMHGHDQGVGGFHTSQELTEKERCLRSLSFSHIDNREQDISSAYENTCDWLFETSRFKEWCSREMLNLHNGVLWIKGNPGAGKSTLMKHAVTHCRTYFPNRSVAAYFFNARGDSLEKTPLGMLRSILYQLLDKDDSLLHRFIPTYRDKCKKHQMWEWRQAELQQFLLSEISECQSQPVLFIDALDECNDHDVESVVDFLEGLSIKAVRAKATVSICLSSRHYPNINMERKIELVVDRMEGHIRDISLYAQGNLKVAYEGLQRDILDKAAGVFMWVVLVIAMINKEYRHGKIESIRETVHKLPSKLDEMFQVILNKNEPDKPETVLMLQWVLFAMRPLRPEELYYAMIAGTSPRNLGSWNASQITHEDIERRIIHSSRGLIEVRRHMGRTVQFIHESVRDFLLRNCRLQTLDSTLELYPVQTSHNRLWACCMSYVMMENLRFQDLESIDTESLYPFLEYASTFLLDHADISQSENDTNSGCLQWLQQAESWFEQWNRGFRGSRDAVYLDRYYLRQKHYRGIEMGFNLAYTLSFGCYRNLIKTLLLDKDIDINTLGGKFGNALQIAIAQDEYEIAMMLLNRGANVNQQCGFFGNALQAAAARGKEAMVAILIKNGADVCASGGVFGSALQAAVARLNKDVVAMLLDNGADIDAQGGIYGNAVQAALVKENMDMVVTLLEKGADIKGRGGSFGSMLNAWFKGKDKVMDTLLEHGADPTAEDGIFSHVLHAAAATGNKRTVEKLLKMGANVNSMGRFLSSKRHKATFVEEKMVVTNLVQEGIHAAIFEASEDFNFECGTALLWAARNGHQSMVETLLSWGADVNVKARLGDVVLPKMIVRLRRCSISIENGIAALIWAARNGHEAIVQLLLRNGADIEARTCHGETALLSAALQGHEGVMKLLIEKGARIEARACSGETALLAVARKGHGEMLKLLLRNGANMEARTCSGETALLLAARKGHAYVANLLLENKADIAATDAQGHNALHLAARSGSVELVRNLLDRQTGALLQAAEVKTVKIPRNNNNILTLEIGDGSFELKAPGGDLYIESLIMAGGSLFFARESSDLPLSWRQLQQGVMRKNPPRLLIGKLETYGGSVHIHLSSWDSIIVIDELGINEGSVQIKVPGSMARVIVKNLKINSGLVQIKALGANAEVCVKKLEATDGSVQIKASSTEIQNVEMKGGSMQIEPNNGAANVFIKGLEMNGRLARKTTRAPIPRAHQKICRDFYLLLPDGKAAAPEDGTKKNSMAILPETTTCVLQAFHAAVECGHEAVVQLLLERHAIVNAKLDGLTALYKASQNSNGGAMTKLLLENGADLDAEDDDTIERVRVLQKHKHQERTNSM